MPRNRRAVAHVQVEVAAAPRGRPHACGRPVTRKVDRLRQLERADLERRRLRDVDEQDLDAHRHGDDHIDLAAGVVLDVERAGDADAREREAEEARLDACREVEVEVQVVAARRVAGDVVPVEVDAHREVADEAEARRAEYELAVQRDVEFAEGVDPAGDAHVARPKKSALALNAIAQSPSPRLKVVC